MFHGCQMQLEPRRVLAPELSYFKGWDLLWSQIRWSTSNRPLQQQPNSQPMVLPQRTFNKDCARKRVYLEEDFWRTVWELFWLTIVPKWLQVSPTQVTEALCKLFLFRGPVLTVSFAKIRDRPSVTVYIWTPKDTLRLFWSSPSALGGRPLWITLVYGPAACCGPTQTNSDTSGRVAFSMVDGVRHRGWDRNEQIPVIFPHIIKALMLSFHNPRTQP